MRHFLYAALLCWFAVPVAAQTKLNPRLKHELDSIYEVDQRYRAMLFEPRLTRNPDSLATALGVSKEALNATIINRMQSADAANMERMHAILKQYGYPGKSLVGAPTNDAAWHVIQHNPATISTYLPLVKVAAEKGEIPFTRYAMMLDRHLMDGGKEQLYGTQVTSYNGKPPFVWPIQNPAQVNQRRKQAGFSDTVEKYVTRFGVTYRVITLEEVEKMPKQ
ncbi:hypothetical protein MTX78_24485 (plasmid) [Hymenobacter tibetensis]|uniref:DUF4919 domain-containing protein n=1 Tax=Hymenobacter tibetensis TaxID=497967 RepID=A0ABY4D8N2_9BACT|nr:DUF6624 domain-containing protein [Hymenobacter tibetensis]UOG77576.1 hypothetical protein MTX78_24485 [Hymenobacter tibetensis]